VIVMRAGRVAGELSGGNIEETGIVRLAMGLDGVDASIGPSTRAGAHVGH